MSQQTENLSTENPVELQSTFKTITETTDSSSKRYYTLTTEKLFNYELRRKPCSADSYCADRGLAARPDETHSSAVKDRVELAASITTTSLRIFGLRIFGKKNELSSTAAGRTQKELRRPVH